VNGHGLALWFTTPLYFWLLWPKRASPRYVWLALTAAAVAAPSLFYQNTGWVQFGYRFSNDYALCLIGLLALGGYRFGRGLVAAIVVAIAVNAWGAMSFGRGDYRQYYFVDPTQKVLFQADR
jgi:hypothetical protein